MYVHFNGHVLFNVKVCLKNKNILQNTIKNIRIDYTLLQNLIEPLKIKYTGKYKLDLHVKDSMLIQCYKVASELSWWY